MYTISAQDEYGYSYIAAEFGSVTDIEEFRESLYNEIEEVSAGRAFEIQQIISELCELLYEIQEAA